MAYNVKDALTDDDKILLERIRNYPKQQQRIVKEDYSDRTGKRWNIDIEFSKLCIEGSGWK